MLNGLKENINIMRQEMAAIKRIQLELIPEKCNIENKKKNSLNRLQIRLDILVFYKLEIALETF